MRIYIDNEPVEFNKFTFPCGEEHIKLGDYKFMDCIFDIELRVHDCRNAVDRL